MMAVFKVMILQIPLLLGYLLPLAFFLSVLIVLGRMYMESEMSVLFACGVSRAKIYGIVMTFALILTLVVGWLMLWAEPIIENYRIVTLEQSYADATINKVIPRRFQRLPHDGMFYAASVSRHPHVLHNVILALKDKPTVKGGAKPWDVTVAREAVEKDIGNNGRFLVFYNGYRFLGVPGEKQYRILRFKEYGVKLVNAAIRVRDWPMNVPTLELLKLAKQNPHAAAAVQWRLAFAISVIILGLIAVPLSYVNPRRGKFFQLIPAIIIYITYADFLFLCRSWMRSGLLTPKVGFWWLHAAFLLLGVLIIIHTTGWKRSAQLLQFWRRRQLHAPT